LHAGEEFMEARRNEELNMYKKHRAMEAQIKEHGINLMQEEKKVE
jgi:hypothetical protein